MCVSDFYLLGQHALTHAILSRAMRNAETLLDMGMSQKLAVDSEADFSVVIPLSSEKRAAITAWVEKQKQIHGQLDIEAYVKSVVDGGNESGKQGKSKSQGRSLKSTMFYCGHLALLCVGGMFSLFATGAISERIMIRADIGESKLVSQLMEPARRLERRFVDTSKPSLDVESYRRVCSIQHTSLQQ